MSIFVEEDNCTGCGACISSCPKSCIEMKVNQHGFQVPKVDTERCISCNICTSVCPQLNLSANSDDTVGVFAFKINNDSARFNSSSGGFFYAVADYILSIGGYVCGCVLEDLRAVHIISNDLDDIKKMQGSKYVQSDTTNTYGIIEPLIRQGKPVLFSGTPCQVAGFQSFLMAKHLSAENVYCLDFICHGVPSPEIWKSYVDFYKKEKRKNPIDYKFRTKKFGWGKKALGGDYYSYFVNNNQKTEEDMNSFLSRFWRYIFLSNICLRKVCNKCLYSSISKPGDITMADFWGIEKISPEFDDSKGCSLVIIQNKKGEELFKAVKQKECTIEKVDIHDAFIEQPNVFSPSKANEKEEEFWHDYDEYGFEYVLKKYFGYSNQLKIKGYIKRILFKCKIRYLY